METLRKHPRFAGAKGPVVLAILDGIGIGKGDEADAVRIAATPTMDRLWVPGARAALRAHGRAVGLPSDDDMGNSEVGHNALGAGVVHDQGAKLVTRAIASGAIFESDAFRAAIDRANRGGAIHFLGLLSDGNVHSHIDHLEALLRGAAARGAKKLYVHALIDGRDVPPTSGPIYVDRIEQVLAELRTSGIDARIVSGGGRMFVTMDRYEADWRIVERGWHAHVLADARAFASALQAIETFRAETPGILDQDLPPFVVEPKRPIEDGDVVVMFNFRGDRAIEISKAFDHADFTGFDRVRRPDVLYVGMMEYDGDLHLPKHYLVSPPAIDHTMGELLAQHHVPQLAISETQKYGHVTYFWNGNRSGMFDEGTETYVEIESDRVPFEQRPWMKAAEITDRVLQELRTGRHRFVRINYANGDMVGHTGSFDATVVAVETVDLQLARLARAVEEVEGILVVTADHGNADEMYMHDKHGRVERRKEDGRPVIRTSHSLNPVPFVIHDPNRADHYEIDPGRTEGAGIANVTATCLELLGYEAPSELQHSLLRFK
ncbi:MAG TPA: 2,3-bisphosphoglycerate-independent phosphoglycerate mutase [Kofleriaceae bacterium]|nr:2,3-bisphosphoglycerate-independent phosphoglycerate mutase [Kofleriaceae bacterium]